MITKPSRAIAAAAAAVIALTAFTLTPAQAEHRGDDAALGAFIATAGTIAAMAASYRDRGYPYGGSYGSYAYEGPHPYWRRHQWRRDNWRHDQWRPQHGGPPGFPHRDPYRGR